MKSYQYVMDFSTGLPLTTCIFEKNSKIFIPFDPANADYQTYLKWLDGYEWQMIEPMKMDWVKTADSNTPEPADE